MQRILFTSELFLRPSQRSNADQISDAILDAMIAQDLMPMACETFVKPA